MESGRCISGKYGNLGCESDVLSWMDRRCSGKTTCEVRVPNNELKEKFSQVIQPLSDGIRLIETDIDQGIHWPGTIEIAQPLPALFLGLHH